MKIKDENQRNFHIVQSTHTPSHSTANSIWINFGLNQINKISLSLIANNLVSLKNLLIKLIYSLAWNDTPNTIPSAIVHAM